MHTVQRYARGAKHLLKQSRSHSPLVHTAGVIQPHKARVEAGPWVGRRDDGVAHVAALLGDANANEPTHLWKAEPLPRAVGLRREDLDNLAASAHGVDHDQKAIDAHHAGRSHKLRSGSRCASEAFGAHARCTTERGLERERRRRPSG